MTHDSEQTGPKLKTVGLFAGIGGLEAGLEQVGHETIMLCEIDAEARAVLRKHFPEAVIHEDVRTLAKLPQEADLVTAGFPCQDLSQAGQTLGMEGDQSRLVLEVLRLLEVRPIPWVLLENVPFMLHLHRGAALRQVLRKLDGLGYRWAYRVIDTRAFGIPQRRRRIFLLAALEEDPAAVLFRGDGVGLPERTFEESAACGFYWTEGNRGLGWAIDEVPTLKGGSSLSIPSPPAIWSRNDGEFGTPDIRDVERLQGFPADWTLPAEEHSKRRKRWKLVGNAVTVDVAEWLGRQLVLPGEMPREVHELEPEARLPNASMGSADGWWKVEASETPVSRCHDGILAFLQYPQAALSKRAARGFHGRLTASSLKYPVEFGDALATYIRASNQRADAGSADCLPQ